MGVTSNWCHPQGHHARRPSTTVPVTTGSQRWFASGCTDVDRDWADRAIYGHEHALLADVTIGTADHFVWMEKSDLQCFAWTCHQVLVVYHIYCHRVIETLALCVLPNWRESVDQVLCCEKWASSSVFIFVYFTQVSQIKAMGSKLRFRALKMLASFEFRASNRPSTHSHPAWCQARRW